MQTNNEAKRVHTIIARNVPEKVYQSLWNLRRKYKATSWHDFFSKLVQEFEEEVKETEWL